MQVVRAFRKLRKNHGKELEVLRENGVNVDSVGSDSEPLECFGHPELVALCGTGRFPIAGVCGRMALLGEDMTKVTDSRNLFSEQQGDRGHRYFELDVLGA